MVWFGKNRTVDKQRKVIMLSKEEVLKIAKLSRLKISDAEIESFAKPLDKLLHYMEDLKALDLSDVEPMTGVEDAPTVLREDVPQPSLSYEQAFANAPEEENGHFVIPKVIG